MIFAREISDPLTGLVKKINEACVAHQKSKLASFVVVLSEEPGTSEKLIALAQKEKIAETILSFMPAEGPKEYHVASEADVTVVLYVKRKVKANHAFKKGEFKTENIAAIMDDLTKILPSR